MNFKLLLTSLLFGLLTSCLTEKCNCPLDDKTLKENIESFKELEKSDSWAELGLEDYSTFKNDVYRLTIYPSWMDSEILQYKLENGGDGTKISISRYERMDISEKTHLKEIGQTEEISLHENDWNQFDNLITEQCFWTMPVGSKSMYFDGTEWILEVKKGRKNSCSNRNYHIVSRVADSPEYFI